jgi:hypothetical protein
MTYIIKSVHVLNTGNAAGVVDVYLLDAGGVHGSIIASQTVTNAFNIAWLGWLVGNPGDGLIIVTHTQPFDVWVSGTKLLGTV